MIVTIERLGHLGDGIAPGPVYVPGMLPGEVVEGELEGSTLAKPRILAPSPQRVKPPCAHARTCGGCALQHASDDFVAGWKQAVVEAALAGQGLSAPFRPIVTSPPRSRRRATLSARRTKVGVTVGFHARGSDMLVAVPDCRLLHPDLIATFPAVATITEAGGSRKGELTLTVTRSLTGPDIAVAGGKALDASLRQQIAALAEAHGIARLTWDGEPVALRVPPVVAFDGIRVTPPPGAFLQATEAGEAALRDAVAEAVGGARRVVDLFAGCGTFALPLARQAEVHAVEGEAALTGALAQGWRQAEGLKRVTTETRDLFRRPLVAEDLRGFDAAVIDPPRAGAEAQTRMLAESGPPRIAAVSCNPVTFARDAAVLVAAGYRLDWVQVVDQFRWSTHVELVACLTRTP
ncbi:class I SAM-dependent RNA methyltransferase [Ruixingdingia sedimenti]|uniref:Class I SAM-dependent RNA methyltransferase n=1 Tax=Ruixingdingia sedimenti TaxID=3073604 RepID=A0ABU1F6Y4_9RHOB|nr:class I SAM-dependent RNA methyltransferase [Xinfangfangia sp. LG-4]MDR5652627.1 class I SAM-dependent RNA methyltransferase [Xinfangfangia sp. LG-4]